MTIKIYLLRLAAALGVLALAVRVAAQPAAAAPRPAAIDFAAIDAYVAAQMHKHSLPGVALAVTQGEQTIYLKGYGTAGGERPLTPQTPMYIGSVSKSFTALAIAQLAEQGTLDLDAPVRRYVPWFRVADPAASAAITLRHLLHHASGLSDAGFGAVLPSDATLEEAVRALEAARLTAPVGSKSQYFNLNYAVLGLVVEVASGQPYADYVTAHIFAPLGMAHSYTSPEAARANGLAQGYSRLFGFAMPRAETHRAYELSDGYLISTAEDMAKFAIAMNNRGASGQARLLSPEGMQQLFTPRRQAGFAYGMGWFVDSAYGIPRIQHGGANETFKTFMQLYPTRKLGLVLMINQGYLIDHYVSAEQLFAGVEQIALGQGQPDPAAGVAVPAIGWGLLALVLALAIFQGWQLWRLRSWRARPLSPARRRLDIGLNFAIPTAIMGVVIWQMAGFFGDRFNLLYQLRMVFRFLPDIGVLMLVGTLPDYAQGLVKLWWVARGQARPDSARPDLAGKSSAQTI